MEIWTRCLASLVPHCRYKFALSEVLFDVVTDGMVPLGGDSAQALELVKENLELRDFSKPTPTREGKYIV
jgi:hypothetical protein